MDGLRILPQQFSSSLLGKVFSLLLDQHRHGQPILLSSLESQLSMEEMKHLTHVVRKQDQLVSDRVLSDCAAIVREEYERSLRSGDDALLAMQARLKEKKGYGG